MIPKPLLGTSAVLLSLAAAACSAPGDRNASPASDTAGRARGTASPDSGANPVAEIIAPDGPESVRYDPAQDVYFISTVGGYGSDRDDGGAIMRLAAR